MGVGETGHRVRWCGQREMGAMREENKRNNRKESAKRKKTRKRATRE